MQLPGVAWRAAHLAVLSSFALAQPLFDILGKNATFFVVRDSSGTQIVLLALAVTLLPPALLILLELGAGLIDEFLALALHLVFVAVLAGMIALQVLKRLDGPTTVLLLAAVLLGLGAAVSTGGCDRFSPSSPCSPLRRSCFLRSFSAARTSLASSSRASHRSKQRIRVPEPRSS